MKTIERDTLSRRQLFPLLGGAVALATVAPRSTAADSSGAFGKPPAAKARFVYVGTYTFPGTAPGGTHQSQAKGIYVFRMNPSNGRLPLLQVAEIRNRPYLALDCGPGFYSLARTGYSPIRCAGEHRLDTDHEHDAPHLHAQ